MSGPVLTNLPPDFVDVLKCLSAAGVRFLLVGAHALAAHGRPRFTNDIDIFYEPTEENVDRVWAALQEFGAPLSMFQRSDFLDPSNVLMMGSPPHRIDFLPSISGVTFQEAWEGRVEAQTPAGTIAVLGLAELIRNKRASDRPKDVVDLQDLEKAQRKRGPQDPSP